MTIVLSRAVKCQPRVDGTARAHDIVNAKHSNTPIESMPDRSQRCFAPIADGQTLDDRRITFQRRAQHDARAEPEVKRQILEKRMIVARVLAEAQARIDGEIADPGRSA